MHGNQTRPATADDAGFVYEVLRQAFRRYVEQTWGWDEEEQIASFQAEYDPAQTEIIVHKGKDVGYLRVEDHGKVLFLDSIAILPTHQGQGLGSALVGRILRRAARESRPVRLHVLRVNPASDLYERLGFRVIGGDEHRIYMEATPVISDNCQRSVGELVAHPGDCNEYPVP